MPLTRFERKQNHYNEILEYNNVQNIKDLQNQRCYTVQLNISEVIIIQDITTKLPSTANTYT